MISDRMADLARARVAAAGLAERVEEINRRGIEHAPDFISIDSGDGGSGAAPMPLMDLVGMPLREALLRIAPVRKPPVEEPPATGS